MRKPFVIITPEADRETLRTCGVLPEGLFRPFDVNSNGLRKDGAEDDEGLPPVYLWPYDLPYNRTKDVEEDGELYKPDVPGLFGLKPPKDEAEKRHNERLITGLLGSVMVHIVFLDTRREGNGYAVFKSFDDIVNWGKSLRKALNVRFRNEEVLQSMESALVIVARGEQVSLKASDIERFNGCVQQYRGDIFAPESSDDPPNERQRKIFNSCYFLDYNLCVRDSRELYHSAEVWDVMVGRLLLSFLLSSKDRIRWWQIPGVKLWRTLDCLAEIDKDSDRRLVDETLALANEAVQDLAAKSEKLGKLPLLHADPEPKKPLPGMPLEPADGLHPEWRKEPSGGWSDFDAAKCASNTAASDAAARWAPAFERIKRAFTPWRIQNGLAEDSTDANDVFKAVHTSPGNLLKAVSGIYAKLLKSLFGDKSPEKDWDELIAKERERRAAAEGVKADAVEFAKAQRHYVGFGMTLVVIMAVCAAFGAAGYYLVYCLCGLFGISIPAWMIALFFFAFIALGSLAAGALMLFCHLKAGRRAMDRLCAESAQVDDLVRQRDGKARQLVEHGLLLRDSLILQARRFRSWALLKRTQDILVTELQPASARRADEPEETDEKPVNDEHESVRGTFLKRTRHAFGPYRITLREDLQKEIDHQIDLWWSEHTLSTKCAAAETKNFIELWRILCADDQELAGYFPARPFSSEIRAFVERFTEAIRLVAKLSVLADHQQEVREGLFAWYEQLQDSEYYLYASGAVTGEHVNEAGLDNARVYFSDETIVDIDRIQALRKSSQADQSRFMPECRTEMNKTRLLALLFQEIRVKFCTDAEGDVLGHLMFKEVSDLAGAENG